MSNNFINGIGKSIDVFAVTGCGSFISRSDEKSLKSDWEQTGNDIFRFVKAYGKKYRSNTSNPQKVSGWR